MDDEIFVHSTFVNSQSHYVPESKMDEKRLAIQDKMYALLLCSIVFSVVYNFSAWHISKQQNIPSFVFDFENFIPFIPWTIIPYLTSGLFFCLTFFVCSSKEQLNVLTKRMLFVTIIAGFFFLFFPLKFSLPKPDFSHSIFGIPYGFLEIVDSPFNQSPSLHIAYAFIFWSVFRNFNKKWRLFLMTWLVLVGISTLTTYQHHFLDILAGTILAHISFILFPFQKNNFKFRNFHIANFYFLLGWILVSTALLLNQFFGLFWLILILPSLIMILVGYQYQKNNVHFLKDKNGHISLLKKTIYFPYQLIYWTFCITLRKNKIPVEILPKVFISSRLSQNDLKNFEINHKTFVYDLSAEMEETSEIKRLTTYYSVPFLDIGTFDIQETEKLIIQITKNYKQLPEDGKILIHCTMGFTRSTVIGILVMKNILSLPLDQAITKMKSINKNYIIHPYVIDFLKKINL